MTEFIKSKASLAESMLKHMELIATSDGTNVHQMSWSNSEKQKWRFKYIGNGEYKIQSLYSNTLLSIYASSPNATANAWIWHDDGTTGQIFRIKRNPDGTYTMYSKCSIFNMVLDVDRGPQWDYGLGDYANVQQWYDAGTSNQKWILEPVYVASVNNYYDNAYPIRYDNSNINASISNINNYQDAVNEIFIKKFGLKISRNSAVSFESKADLCSVVGNNINALCSSHFDLLFRRCTHENAMRDDFDWRTNESTNLTHILWSGHRLEENRCFSYEDTILMINLFDPLTRNEDSESVLLHELMHQFDGPDHYCENMDLPAGIQYDCGISLCWRHKGSLNPRPRTCIMDDGYQNITQTDIDTLICIACKQDVLSHLNNHH